MNRYTIVKSKGKLKRVEINESGEKTQLGKKELPEQANWQAIERARKRKKEGKKGKPPWVGKGKNPTQ